MDNENALIIYHMLEELYPEARAELFYRNPFELLIATILSAQCTDKRVNMVTKRLYAKYPDAATISTLALEELEGLIKECGLYKNKAKNISETCKILCTQFIGIVPNDYDELIKLPGVGRKTANVVLSNAFGKPAIAVGTHVFRVTNRIGLANANNVLKTEHQLMELYDADKWSKLHHLLIWHGRRCCKAIKPNCNGCTLNQMCEKNGIDE